MPLYQLLGGASRSGVMVYGHANGRRHRADRRGSCRPVHRHGPLQRSAQTGDAGLEKVYGVGRGTMFYEPADADLPSVTGWDTRNHTPQLFEAARDVRLTTPPAA